MKIYRTIFSEMISLENLLRAWDRFRKGKRKKHDVQFFELYLEDNFFRLYHELMTKQYRHAPYTAFSIRDPKMRRIHKAEVRDRIVHHALVQALNPIFEPTFIADSYSGRVARGTHRGVQRLHLFTKQVYQTYSRCFILKCDIKKFFASIDHTILIGIISKRVKDPDALWLIRAIVESFSSEFSTPTEPKGAPIGNLTSQLFANIYMNELDQFIKHTLRISYYIRYTDDFVIIHYDRNYLLAVKKKNADFLETALKLSLHPQKTAIRTYAHGVDFLGYITLPRARILRTTTKRRMFGKLRKQVMQWKLGVITEQELIQSFNSYCGVLRHANSHQLEQKLRHKFWEWLKETKNAPFTGA